MKIKMIFLAAGNSRRFGSNKLYAMVGEKPMFRYGLETLEEILRLEKDTTLTVVTDFDWIKSYTQERKKLWGDRIETVSSPESEKGISYSIRAGLEGPRADYYLFSVADQPWIRPDTVLALIRTVRDGGYAGGYVSFCGTGGNPAMFSDTLYPDLWGLQGDTGGKKILKNIEHVCCVEAQEALELQDIDEMTVLEKKQEEKHELFGRTDSEGRSC